MPDSPLFKRPERMNTRSARRKTGEYCEFHRDYGHHTDDCFKLKDEVESLIRRGYLGDFIYKRDEEGFRRNRRGRSPGSEKFERRDRSTGESRERRNPSMAEDRWKSKPENQYRGRSRDRASQAEQKKDDDIPTVGRVGVVSGGIAAGGESSSGRKAYARERNEPEGYQRSHKRLKYTEDIIFRERDSSDLIVPHDDPLVIETLVASWEVARILVDTGSSTDIIYFSCLEAM